MRTKPETSFNEKDWACVTLQAPLGTVVFARKLPVVPPPARPSGSVSDWISRRFASSNPPDSTAKRPRSRR